MRVLVACEFSGIVRDAFSRLGHDAWSCDIRPTESPGNHLRGDCRKFLGDGWDLMVCHPPCTHISRCGARFWKFKEKKQKRSLEFVLELLNAPIPMICLENPVGMISTRIARPSQTIHPWMFGDPFSKPTCLWLKNLPILRSTKVVSKGEFVTFPRTGTGKPKRMAKWFYDARHSEGGKGHGKARSRTFQGIADAMAEQWGCLPLNHTIGLGFSGARWRIRDA